MSYRDRRSPDRGRERYPPPAPIDSYIPPTSSRAAKPRSRSPGSYRGRSRTPPRHVADTWRGRLPSPRRVDARVESYPSRPRSPRRDFAYNAMSRPSRERSPLPVKRERDPSPHTRGGRSPQPMKRERISPPIRDYGRPKSPQQRAYSPSRDARMNYRTRSRSPRREDRVDPYVVKSWRRQSPSPRVDSERNSGATSQRSSQRPYNRRSADPAAMEDVRIAPASSYRSPARMRSPFRDVAEPYDSRPRPPLGRELPANDPDYPPRDAMPSASAEYRERPPPTGPASSYREGPASAISPPTGPSATTLSMSAHNRPGPPSAPAYPRGGFGTYRGRGGIPSRDYPPPKRGPSSWGSGPSYGRGGVHRDPYPSRDPAAPYENRSSLTRSDSGYRGGLGSGPMAFRRSSNSTSMTYPHTQRFNQAVAGIPEVKEGGEKLPPLHDTTKADKLEEEAARLRKMIDDKELKKRQGLREWEKLEKESSNASLRSELAEEHLRSLNGEGEGIAAAF